MATATATIKTFLVELVSTKSFSDLIGEYPEEAWDWGPQRAETIVLAFNPSSFEEWLEHYNKTHDYPLLWGEEGLERIEWRIESVKELLGIDEF